MHRIRLCKSIMVALVASYISLVIFNNLMMPHTNLAYVQHVLSMDSLSDANNQLWRSITSPGIHTAGFIAIVILEVILAVLCWLGAWKMVKSGTFCKGKELATIGLTLAMVIWFGVFFIIGGEWFLAWQTS